MGCPIHAYPAAGCNDCVCNHCEGCHENSCGNCAAKGVHAVYTTSTGKEYEVTSCCTFECYHVKGCKGNCYVRGQSRET